MTSTEPVYGEVVARHTKIIATLGPAVDSYEAIAGLIEAGIDVARLNFSHGDHEMHRRHFDWVRKAAEEHGRTVAMLQDIQGPKIRVGSFPDGFIELDADDTLVLRPGRDEAVAGEAFIDYDLLLDDIAPGQVILLADGLIRLHVERREDDHLIARVVQGGRLSDNKGVAFPETNLTVPIVTEKDRLDLAFGRELGFEYVAASFVRSGADIEEVRSHIDPDVPIIAKVELAMAYDNLDDILSAADGVMVARGDLGVELPLQRIPLVQRDILRRTNNAGRISITATEMLESMTHSPRPTRAEVTDVANAVLSGTDAVMLSGETAVGQHPQRVVEAMNLICLEVESSAEFEPAELGRERRSFASATARAAAEVAANLGLSTIVAFTESGSTARLISKQRPSARIIAFSAEPATLRRMALMWGVTPVEAQRRDHTDLMIASAEKYLEKSGICERGDGVVMVAGIPPNEQASTNLIKLHTVGERLHGLARRGRS